MEDAGTIACRKILADRAGTLGLYADNGVLGQVMNSEEFGLMARALAHGQCVIAWQRTVKEKTAAAFQWVRTIEWISAPSGVGPFEIRPWHPNSGA